jgi:hypothetical protein
LIRSKELDTWQGGRAGRPHPEHSARTAPEDVLGDLDLGRSLPQVSEEIGVAPEAISERLYDLLADVADWIEHQISSLRDADDQDYSALIRFVRS